MVSPVSAPESMSPASARPNRVASAIVAVGAGFLVLVLAGAIGLWAHYGTAVFFEMIKSGIAACM